MMTYGHCELRPEDSEQGKSAKVTEDTATPEKEKQKVRCRGQRAPGLDAVTGRWSQDRRKAVGQRVASRGVVGPGSPGTVDTKEP